ncbi:hypothetical protein Shyhy01_56700 [Streptomyces hygroscopicus subsp. hygroscopicus]|nr:hypothetical protein Shyhy01_56700 [Streptomyces hygroscopicus subsp. hygroscopicus]
MNTGGIPPGRVVARPGDSSAIRTTVVKIFNGWEAPQADGTENRDAKATSPPSVTSSDSDAVGTAAGRPPMPRRLYRARATGSSSRVSFRGFAEA